MNKPLEDFFKSPFWAQNRKYSKQEALLDLWATCLLSADRKANFSLSELAMKWKWSKASVLRFLRNFAGLLQMKHSVKQNTSSISLYKSTDCDENEFALGTENETISANLEKKSPQKGDCGKNETACQKSSLSSGQDAQSYCNKESCDHKKLSPHELNGEAIFEILETLKKSCLGEIKLPITDTGENLPLFKSYLMCDTCENKNCEICGGEAHVCEDFIKGAEAHFTKFFLENVPPRARARALACAIYTLFIKYIFNKIYNIKNNIYFISSSFGSTFSSSLLNKTQANTQALTFKFSKDLSCGEWCWQSPELESRTISQWSGAYPNCDVKEELLKAREWLIANPKSAKKNYRRFMTNWLNRANNSNSFYFGNQKKEKTPPEESNSVKLYLDMGYSLKDARRLAGGAK